MTFFVPLSPPSICNPSSTFPSPRRCWTWWRFFVPRHSFAMWPDAPHDQQHGLLPSTTTSISRSRQTRTLGISWKLFLLSIIWISVSPVPIPALLMRAFTSLTSPNLSKKAPNLSSAMSTSTLMVSQLTTINFRLFTSAVSREIVRLLTASNAFGIARNSFPLMDFLYLFLISV